MKEEMPLVFENCGEKSCPYRKECCAKVQQAADLAILRAERLGEVKRLEEIKKKLPMVPDVFNEHIAALRAMAGDSKPDVKITWPNERYHLDGEGCKEK